MKLKICQIRDSRTAFQLVEMGVDYLGFHVLETLQAEHKSRAAGINKRLRASGFDGGVLLTKVNDVDWLVNTTMEGQYRYVQVHRDADLDGVAELARRLREHGISLIQVIDPLVHDAAYVTHILSHADYVLYDNYTGGTGCRISYDVLEGMPMDRAFIAGGVDDISARQLKSRFSPYGVDVQTWVKGPDKSKDMDKVSALIEIVGAQT